jgi:cytochrome c556
LPDRAMAQDQTAVTKDLIFARKILMDTIGKNMDEIEGFIETPKPIDLAEGKEHADIISVMLMSFPHLFAPASNQWSASAARDPGVDTFASPDIWKNYNQFYKFAEATSKIAFNASRSKTEPDYRKYAGQLRPSCDACHSVFMKLE